MFNPITRKASVRWTGGVKGGSGAPFAPQRLPSEGKALSKASRRRQVDTTAAELMAAAHANSFSFALSNELRLPGKAAGNTLTTSNVTLARSSEGWTITRIHLDVVAWLPHVTQGSFIDASVRAKTSCLISRLLRISISMNAKLV